MLEQTRELEFPNEKDLKLRTARCVDVQDIGVSLNFTNKISFKNDFPLHMLISVVKLH